MPKTTPFRINDIGYRKISNARRRGRRICFYSEIIRIPLSSK